MSNQDEPRCRATDETASLRRRLSELEDRLRQAEESERASLRSEARFELALRGASDGLWDWDLATDEVYYSPRWKSMLGYAEREIKHHLSEWKRLLHPDDRDRALAEVDAYLASCAEFFETEFRMVHKGGRSVFILARGFGVRDAAGNVVRMVGTNVDITQRKQAEEALRKSVERYQRLEANIPGFVYIYAQHPDGSLSFPYASARSRELFDIDPEDIMRDGTLLANLAHPDDRQMRDESIQRSAETLEPWQVEMRLIVRGEIRWFDCMSRPKREPNGDILWDGIVLDITDRKRAEEERLAHLRFLESMQRINRAIRGTTEPEQTMSDVLDVVLSVFECDRAWLLYPCDPDAPSWRVPMERTRPEYPGAHALGLEVPMSQGDADGFRAALASKDPITFGPGAQHPIPPGQAEQFGHQSQIVMAIRPNVGKPWLFGMHQCSHVRLWTEQEKRLFQEIGRRLADALTTTLTLRNLEESEQRFRTLVDHSADAIGLIDFEGRFVQVNSRLCENLGYTREELLGMGVADIDPTFIPGEHERRYWGDIQADDVISFETQHRRKDGSVFPIDVRLCLVEMRGRKLILASGRDITERKRAEEERLAYMRFLESMGQIDRAIRETTDLDQMVSDVLDVALSIFDCDRALLIYPCDPDAPCWQVRMARGCPGCPGTPDLGADVPMEQGEADAFRLVLASERPVKFGPGAEHSIPSGEAERFGHQSKISTAVYPKVGKPWVFALHQCSRARVWTAEEERLFQEIGRRLADALTSLLTLRNLQESEQRFRTLLEQSADAIAVHDFEGNLVEASTRTCKQLGYSRDELLGMNVADIDPTFVLDERKRSWNDLSSGKAISFETKSRRKDGSIFPIDVRLCLVEMGGRRLILCSVCDITERKLAEEERFAHLRFLESMEQIDRAIRGTMDPDQMMRDVLDVVLSIFDCDRAWLFYPCDPDAPSWHIPVESTRPEYPGAYAMGGDLPIMEGLADSLRTVLASEGPVRFGPDAEHPVSPAETERFGQLSQMSMALYPKVGEPWMFGLHQCSYARVWTVQEERIFQEIGRRLADALTSLLTLRDLQESEQRFRTLVEQSVDAVGLHDLDGRFIEVNSRLCESLGYTRDELLGMNVADVDPTFATDERKPRWLGSLQPGQAISFETHNRRKDGSFYPIDVRVCLVEMGGRSLFLAAGRDITERKRAEEERLAHMRFLESMGQIDRAIRGTTDLDQMVGDVLDVALSIFDCDRAWLLHPCDPDAPAWQVPMERARPEYAGSLAPGTEIPMQQVVADTLRVALASGGPVKFGPGTEHPIPPEQTERFGLQSQMSMAVYPKVGEPWMFGLHQCSYARVWTAEEERLFQEIGRRLADALTGVLTLRNLQESEQRFRTLVEQSVDAVGLHDSDGRFIEVNSRLCENLGYTRDELLGMNVADIDPSFPTDERKQRLLRELRPDQAMSFETQNRRKDGTFFPIDVRLCRVEMGGRRLFLAAGRDITERKRAEEEKERLEAQLRQAQKMEAIGQLAGGVAHDFNNILTAILGNVELAISELDPHFPAARSLLDGMQQIQQSAERASALTRQLLAFSRRQILHPEVLNLNAILGGLEKMLRRLITEEIELELSLDPELAAVEADPGQLEQVIVNLVVNARDAMPQGGRLLLETSNVVLDDAYLSVHAEAQEGPHVVLAVSDTGSGMDPETLERIFEPFFTTKPVHRGTGLGLSTAYGIVKQAGGHVTVCSELGEGTTFHVFLPSVRGPVAPAERVEARIAPPIGTEAIILCEDDVAVRDLAAHMLERAGYTVLVAQDAAHALQLAGDHPGKIDLLVTDVIMPDMNGKALSDALTSLRPDAKTLFVSGYASDVIAPHGVVAQDVEFLQKPFTRFALLSRVRKVLDVSVPSCESPCPKEGASSDAAAS